MTYLIFVFLLQLSPTEFAYQRAEGTPQIEYASMSECETALQENPAVRDLVRDFRKLGAVSAVCVTALAKN